MDERVRTIALGAGEADLTWGFFLLQAARGAYAVPGWALGAFVQSVSVRVGVPADALDDEALAKALDHLPADPIPVLRGLLAPSGIMVPEAGAAMRLPDGSALGIHRDAVPQADLLHDAAAELRTRYPPRDMGPWIDGLTDSRHYDARCAVVVMLVALLLR
jgi:hypothetical protein